MAMYGGGGSTSDGLKDRAEFGSGSVDWGTFFEVSNIFKVDPTAFSKADINDGGWVKGAVEWYNSVAELAYNIHEKYDSKKEQTSAKSSTPTNDVDPAFKEAGKVVYHRDFGYKTKNTDGKGGGQIVDNAIKATDTFPKEKIPGYYEHPRN